MSRARLALGLGAALAASSGCARPLETVVVVRDGSTTAVTQTPNSTTTTSTTTSTTTPPTTTTSTTTTTTTTTTPPDPLGPELRRVVITELDATLDVSFQVTAGDASLDGGTVLVDFDGVDLALDIPDDLDTFDGVSGSLTLDRPTVGACASAEDHDIGVEVVDAAARGSGEVQAQISTTAVGVIVDEIGESTASVIGFATIGTLVCGYLDSTGNDGTNYTADQDLVLFEVSSPLQATLRLDWDAIGDYDLLLYTVDNQGVLSRLDGAIAPDVHGPELLPQPLARNVDYVWSVAGWSGDPGDWSITFQ